MESSAAFFLTVINTFQIVGLIAFVSYRFGRVNGQLELISEQMAGVASHADARNGTS